MSDYKRYYYGGPRPPHFKTSSQTSRDVDKKTYQYYQGPEPYIPPITEDVDNIPEDYGEISEEEEILEFGHPPAKRREVIKPTLFSYDENRSHIDIEEDNVGIELDLPDFNHITNNYQFVSPANLRDYFYAESSLDDEDDARREFMKVYGPFDSFANKMSTVEFSISQARHEFGDIAEMIPHIGYQLALCAVWAKKHLERLSANNADIFYKAMVNIHCVFKKEYSKADEAAGAPKEEYRRFIFDQMCENNNGEYLKARDDMFMFKMVYNTFVKLAYEKLDGRHIENVPNIDSRFKFHTIATACVTIFRYNPINAASFIPLPPTLSKKKGIINPKVNRLCFYYSVLLGKMVASMREEEWKIYAKLNEAWVLDRLFEEHKITANFDSVDAEVFHYSEKNMEIFSADNPDLFITVWVPSESTEDRIPVHPIWQSRKLNSEQKVIHLLLLAKNLEGEDDCTEEEVYADHHFACIFSIDTLFYASSGRHKVHICPVCMVRRRIDNRGLGFCELHENAQFKLAINGTFDTSDEIKDAVRSGHPQYRTVFETLCPRCSNNFESVEALQAHTEECIVRDNNFRIINLPKEREYLQLKGSDRIKLSMLHSFMVADFESVLSPLGSFSGNQYFESEHVPCSYSLVMESDYPELTMFRVFTGKSADETIEDFCKTIIEWSEKAHAFYRTNLPMKPLSPEQRKAYKEAVCCYICGRVFTGQKGSRKVHDHDHLNGEYIGAACEGCNINRRPDRMILPLFFHNGKNYDTHLLIKEITKAKYDCKFEGIAQNSQKIMSFRILKFRNEEKEDGTIASIHTMCDIVVLDSILFLLSSLAKLTEVQKHKSKWDGSEETEQAMRGYEDVFPITYKFMRYIYNGIYQCAPTPLNERYYDPRITLALRKNAYPYLWFKDFKNFKKPISELTKLFDERKYEEFTENVTDEFKTKFEDKIGVYHKVIDAFGFQTVDQYVKLYVSMDTLQLADILQETRKVYQSVHKLDMFQFFGLPGYTWAAFQLHIDDSPFKPWLFKEGEMDMVCFIARAIRGGCSGSMLRYSHVNNPHMEDPDLYDESQPNKYLLYLDANNLYGWSMSQDLPYGNFAWEESGVIEALNESMDVVIAYLEALGNGNGAFIMCDLEFPPETHDRLNWYPLAPVSGYVPEEWISGYSRYMHELAGTQHDSKSRLLLQTLTKREKYVTYYKNLLFYLKHGMVITRVHKILKFSEAPIMRSYIDLNTQHRNMATSVAEKNQWKNANNSAYGKTFENQLNYSILKFVSGENDYNKVLRNPGFNGYAFVSDNLMLAKIKHTSIVFNKPIYLGAVITELAKLHMFEFYYDVLMDHFGEENMKLCMTDTDSLLVEIQCDDIYREIAWIQVHYDCPIDTTTLSKSVIEQYSICGEHNKEVGYFKLEADPLTIQEFVGLRPKVYSMREMDNPEPHMRSKGTPRESMELYMRHENYLRCLFHNNLPENVRQYVDVNKIQSKDHHLYSIKTSKVSISCNDSKRFIMQDNVHTLAYGHYAIPQYIRVYEKGIPLAEGEEFVSPLIEGIEENEINFI